MRALFVLSVLTIPIVSAAASAQDVCGNGVVESAEECDDGGVCIGGNLAGTACTSDADCGTGQPGVCTGGIKLATTCHTDADCPGATCVRCRTFGGDGCAANCTNETSIGFTLVPGIVQGLNIAPGTSGVKLYGDVIPELPLPLMGTQVLTIGKERNGQIPAIIKAASVQLPKVPISNIACACVRALPAKTCGGTLFTETGDPAGNCSDNIPNPVACSVDRPCAYVNGPGNSAAGNVGCTGLDPVNADMTQDCNAMEGAGAFPPQLTLSGAGPAGAALLVNTFQIGTDTGLCKVSFCTDADRIDSRGNPVNLPCTTGEVTATALNVSNLEGENLGPHTVTGAPFSCSDLTASPPSVAGSDLACGWTACDSPTVGDVVLTGHLVAGPIVTPGAPTPTPSPTPFPPPIRGNYGRPTKDTSGCQVGWYVINPNQSPDRFGLPSAWQVCTDGDPSCDVGFTPGVCELSVRICANNARPELPACTPNGVAAVSVLGPHPESGRTTTERDLIAADLANLNRALLDLRDPQFPYYYGVGVPLSPAQQNFCSPEFVVTVPLGAGTVTRRERTLTLKTRSVDFSVPRAPVQLSRLRLTCRAATP